MEERRHCARSIHVALFHVHLLWRTEIVTRISNTGETGRKREKDEREKTKERVEEGRRERKSERKETGKGGRRRRGGGGEGVSRLQKKPAKRGVHNVNETIPLLLASRCAPQMHLRIFFHLHHEIRIFKTHLPSATPPLRLVRLSSVVSSLSPSPPLLRDVRRGSTYKTELRQFRAPSSPAFSLFPPARLRESGTWAKFQRDEHNGVL